MASPHASLLAGGHKQAYQSAMRNTLGKGAEVSETPSRPPGQYLHPTLKSIIRRVWLCRGVIMGAPEPFREVADIIRLEKPGPPETRAEMEVLQENFQILLGLRDLGRKYNCAAMWQLQQLTDIDIEIKQVIATRRRCGFGPIYTSALKEISKRAFIWFSGHYGGGATHRLYINVQRNHCLDVMEFVLNSILTRTECYGAKILPPVSLGQRSDSIVVYLSKGGLLFAKQAIMNSTFPPTYFGQGLPAMTERLLPGIGVGSGEEPRQVAIGLKPVGGIYGAQKQQSFVTFRSELILAALLDIQVNYPDMGHYVYSQFEGRVMDAFRGYGIDPALPWQSLEK